MSRKDELYCEFDRFQGHLPEWLALLLEKSRAPGAIWVRIPLALAAGGFLGFLPILGFWILPLGPRFWRSTCRSCGNPWRASFRSSTESSRTPERDEPCVRRPMTSA
jgi:hypothetical protein